MISSFLYMRGFRLCGTPHQRRLWSLGARAHPRKGDSEESPGGCGRILRISRGKCGWKKGTWKEEKELE